MEIVDSDTSIKSLEAEFFGSSEQLDPELLRIYQRPPLFQLLLIWLIMAFAGLVGYTYHLELLYAFASDEPIHIGALEELSSHVEADPDFLLQYPSNSYVYLSGIPQRRSGNERKLYHQLVGAPVFVELPRDDYDPRFRDITLIPTPEQLEQRSQRHYIETTGRWIRFSDLGRRESGLIDFYQRGYNLWFCSKELTREQRQFFRLQREELRTQLAAQLERDPTPEELELEFHRQFQCQHGFLFQAGRAPSDHRTYLVLFIFLALIELVGVGFSINWFRRTVASLRR